MTTGDNNTIIGSFSGNENDLDIRTSNNNIVLSDGDGNPRIHIDGNGYIKTGDPSGFDATRANNGTIAISHDATSDSEAGLQIRSKRATSGTHVNTVLFYRDNNSIVGSIQTNSSGVQYNTTSDARLKENVADMSGAITRVKSLSPKRFNFIANPDDTVDGFIAHEVQTVVPEAVSGTQNEVDDNGDAVHMMMDQSRLVPLLTGALKEAIAKIETLETKVAALEAK
jgi:nitrogen regulatory protein PII-like uncharacterized protein